MPDHVETQLIRYLAEAHAMESQSVMFLRKAAGIVGDEAVARIYRAHELQTEEHVHWIAQRLDAHNEKPSRAKDLAMEMAGVSVGLAARFAHDTPIRVASAAFAFENLEIAAYRMTTRLARRAGDIDTVAIIERILAEEEGAAEAVAATFARTIELALSEPARSPVPVVTPLDEPTR